MRDAFLTYAWAAFAIVNLASMPVWVFQPITPRRVQAMLISLASLAGCWVCSFALTPLTPG
jgi:hypothetical protein